MAEDEKVYTIEEIAKLLRVSIGTIRRFVATGELESYHVGRQYRITQSALDAYLNRSQKQQEDR